MSAHHRARLPRLIPSELPGSIMHKDGSEVLRRRMRMVDKSCTSRETPYYKIPSCNRCAYKVRSVRAARDGEASRKPTASAPWPLLVVSGDRDRSSQL